MSGSGIRQQTLLVAAIPIMAMALLLGAYSLYVRFSDLEGALFERGEALAHHLAVSSEFAVFTGDVPTLQSATEYALHQPDVTAVAILDGKGKPLASASHRELGGSGLSLVGSAKPVYQDGRVLVLFVSVMPAQLELDAVNGDHVQSVSTQPLGAVVIEISKKRLKQQKMLTVLITLLVMLLVLGLSSLIAMRAARRISMPVQEIEQVLRKIGRGDLLLRIAPKFKVDELNELALGINAMAAQLQQDRELLHQRIEEATRELRLKKMEAERLSEQLGATLNELETIIDANPDILYVLDTQGNLVKWNANLEKLCGMPGWQIRSKCALEFFCEEDRPAVEQWMARVLEQGMASVEAQCVRHDGQLVPYLCNGVVLKDASGRVIGFTGTGRDITERKQAAERMKHMAHYDALTDLPNRAMFSDRLQQALAVARREGGRMMALVFIDLDEFKPINDTLGHAMGDKLLKAVAERMRGCVRESDTIARFGGDEFVVLLPQIAQAQDALLVAEKIRAEVCRPFELDDACMQISTSIGIALYPQHGTEESDLLRSADVAMYAAKQAGRNQVKLFGAG